ncbi:MAG: GTPase Era [Neisseriaceae bacterium]|nr:MAG: GTPase Era [Neisseriaceae bacterium]
MINEEKNHLNKATFCGFISIIGRPNVGKSTLMNHLIGQKISITSRKPQTTRHKVTGVYTKDNVQFIFVDTPGFQKLNLNNLNKALNQSVVNTLNDVDIIVYVVEAGIFNAGDLEVLNLLPKNHQNVFLVVNKQDKIKNKAELNEFVTGVSRKFPFKKVITVAAKHNTGTSEMLDSLAINLPESVLLYPEDQLTDKSNSFMASEIIREKLFRSLGEELPYSLMVDIDKFEATSKLTKIFATIVVDRDNQKPIIIGKGGEKLKKISIESRLDMENLFGTKVHLEIWVKVKKGFADELKFLQQFE